MTENRKDPAELEREATRTRQQIDQTVHEIEHRLSPGQLLDQVLGTVREHGGELGRNLGGQVKENPAALILTGVGLAWLTLGQGRTSQNDSQMHSDTSPLYASPDWSGTVKGGDAESSVSSAKDSIKRAAGSVRDKAAATKDKYRDARHSVADSAHKGKAKILDAKLHMHDSVQRSSQRAKELFDEHPLLVGGLGVAIGAALGAFLPPTETEDEMIGERSDKMTDKLKAEASKKYEQARDKTRQVAEEAGNTLGSS